MSCLIRVVAEKKHSQKNALYARPGARFEWYLKFGYVARDVPYLIILPSVSPKMACSVACL